MIEELLAKNESSTLEFKENTMSLPNIIKAVIAFSNTAGGIIVIGVEDRAKKVVGVANVLDEEERLTNAIADSIVPLLLPVIEIQTYQGKELILINVAYAGKVCYLKSAGLENGVYIRFGSTNRKSDSVFLDSLKYAASQKTFDEIPEVSINKDALDWDAITKAFSAVNKKITEQKAQDLGLLTSHIGELYPSRGGMILFGRERMRFYSNAEIRCVRFFGLNKAAKAIDHTIIDAYQTIAVNQVMNFIERNTSKAAEIGRIYRVDIPEYPVLAVREAVINAIIHADYSMRGSSILVAIFNDRIEITNPGGVPFGTTLERVLEGSSRLRNRVIARVFRELGIIEQWGSGLKKIIDACAERGLKPPLFEDFVIDFKVTLYSSQMSQVQQMPIDKSQKKVIDFVKKKRR